MRRYRGYQASAAALGPAGFILVHLPFRLAKRQTKPLNQAHGRRNLGSTNPRMGDGLAARLMAETNASTFNWRTFNLRLILVELHCFVEAAHG